MSITLTDTLNYRGELFLIGQYKTPFLNAISGKSKRSSSFMFSMAQPWSLVAASQPSIKEDDSIGTLTPVTTARAEDTNTAQIFQYPVQVSFKKQSQYGLMSGINTNQGNPVTDELSFQKTAALRQFAVDLEFTAIQGTYQAAANTGTAAKTRGILAGTTTNAVAGGSAYLTRAMIDTLLRSMATNGAQFQDCAILVNAFQKQAISKLYEYVPQSRNEGGSNIQRIETDFGMFSVIYTPQMLTTALAVVDLSMCAPVFVPVSFSEGNGVQSSMDGVDVLWQPTATTAAAYGGFFYGQVGLDYGAEEAHGKITGLLAS